LNQLIEKEINASLLSFSMIAITRVLHYIASLILLFLLTPQDFGIMAIVMSVMAIMNSLSSFGIDASLISYRGDETKLSNEAWTLELIKGFALASLIIFLAPFISVWLSEPRLEPLLIFMSIGFILQSSKNIGLVSMRKNIDFSVIFKCEIGMALANFFTTIIFVSFYKSPWAIASGYICGWAFYFFLSYFLCSYRPKLSFGKKNILNLLGYSKWILISGQINSILDNGINLLIGNQFGISLLGQFERANMFTRQTALQVGEVIWKVGLPSLSARSASTEELKNQYLLMLSYVCILIFPLLILVNIYIPFFLELNDSRDWSQFSVLLILLGFIAALSMLMTPGSILFQAIRMPNIGFKVAFLRFSITLILIIPLIKFFGILGVIFSLLFGVCIALPYTLYNVKKLIGISLLEHLIICLKHLAPCFIFIILSPGEVLVLWDIIIFLITLTGYFLILYMSSVYFRKAIKYFLVSFLKK
jgi:lipopolysaccharide exporter